MGVGVIGSEIGPEIGSEIELSRVWEKTSLVAKNVIKKMGRTKSPK